MDHDPKTPRHWLLNRIDAVRAIVDGLDDPSAVSSINIECYDSTTTILLSPAAWSRVAEGRTVTWDANLRELRARAACMVGGVHIVTGWTQEELVNVAPDVAASVFPDPSSRLRAITTWSPK